MVSSFCVSKTSAASPSVFHSSRVVASLVLKLSPFYPLRVTLIWLHNQISTVKVCIDAECKGVHGGLLP